MKLFIFAQILVSLIPMVAAGAQRPPPPPPMNEDHTVAHCSRVTVRKEVHDMTDYDVKVYRDTIRQAINTKDPDGSHQSIWQAAARVHNENNIIVHNNAAFLYW